MGFCEVQVVPMISMNEDLLVINKYKREDLQNYEYLLIAINSFFFYRFQKNFKPTISYAKYHI